MCICEYVQLAVYFRHRRVKMGMRNICSISLVIDLDLIYST